MDVFEYIVFGSAIPIWWRRLAKSGLMGSDRAFGSWLAVSDDNAARKRGQCQQIIGLGLVRIAKICIFRAYSRLLEMKLVQAVLVLDVLQKRVPVVLRLEIL